jgi:hypothetical protein
MLKLFHFLIWMVIVLRDIWDWLPFLLEIWALVFLCPERRRTSRAVNSTSQTSVMDLGSGQPTTILIRQELLPPLPVSLFWSNRLEIKWNRGSSLEDAGRLLSSTTTRGTLIIIRIQYSSGYPPLSVLPSSTIHVHIYVRLIVGGTGTPKWVWVATRRLVGQATVTAKWS